MPVFFSLILAAATWSGTVVTADEQGHDISIVDMRTLQVRSVPLPIAPHNVQTSADRRYLYVTGMDAKNEMDMSHMDSSNMSDPDMAAMMKPQGFLMALDLRHPNAAPLFNIPLGAHPAHVVVDRQNRFAYVTVSGDDAVKVVDLQRKSVVALIHAGKMPHGLRMSPDERTIYVADMNGGTVAVIDVAQRRVVASVPVGETPVQVAVSLTIRIAGWCACVRRGSGHEERSRSRGVRHRYCFAKCGRDGSGSSGRARRGRNT